MVTRRIYASLALLLTVLPFSPGPAQSTRGRSIMPQAVRDEAALARTHPAPRDLAALVRQFGLSHPASPPIRTTTPAVGHVASLYVAQAAGGYTPIRAMLVLTTPHAYWYVGPQANPTFAPLRTALRRSAHDFETRIYPTLRAAFGPEVATGPDGDPHLSVLYASLPGTGSYYTAEDLLPRRVWPYSNQRKIIYINSDAIQAGTDSFGAALASSFQHMIRKTGHEQVAAWIDDGASLLAEVLAGYTPQDVDTADTAFAAAPQTGLDAPCYGPPDCTNSSAYFGAAFQWMTYVYQHYGHTRALHALRAEADLNTMQALDRVLARLGTHDRVRDVFRRWVIANLLNNPTLAGGAYGYQPLAAGCCLNTVLVPSWSGTYPATEQGQVPQFGASYIELGPSHSGTLHLRFQGDPTVPIVANQPVQAGMEWWSNRGDEMDSTLTHAFDLRHVRRATLHYDLWYQTEPAYDYGYVAVSTDAGQTWRTLAGRATTTRNPNGNNLGHGYTGSSATQRGNVHGWLHEQVDLSPYAGRRILVRFEHITDDALNYAGMMLDNVRIPQIGFVDAPGMSGWQARGWLRVFNVLPTHWSVQVVSYTHHGVEVHPLALTANAQGQMTIKGPGRAVQRVVVVLAPTALQTTISSRYTLSVR